MMASGMGARRVASDEDVIEKAGTADPLDAVKMFVAAGADIDAQNDLGNTALHYAAYNRRDLIVQFLIDHGAKLEVKNIYGETPLWLAEMDLQFAAGGLFEVRRSTTGDLLRKAGAQPIPAPYKLRPLYWLMKHV